ncbi:MAG: hypothetical protein C0501_19270 [Isosphaera sp.]|nr:hypothetical protein [Isosphaera sp.]
MTRYWNVSSWLAGVACGVCLMLAVMATPGAAHADEPCPCCFEQVYTQECEDACGCSGFIFCMWNCLQPNCGALHCLCATPGFTCKYKLGSMRDCDCRL